MKKILSAYCILFVIVSCGHKEKDPDMYPNLAEKNKLLYIQRTDIDPSDSNQIENRKVEEVTAASFEINLERSGDDSRFIAQRNDTSFGAKRIYICDWCGAAMTFQTTACFLKFMSAKGYERYDQKKSIKGMDYKFNKKISYPNMKILWIDPAIIRNIPGC